MIMVLLLTPKAHIGLSLGHGHGIDLVADAEASRVPILVRKGDNRSGRNGQIIRGGMVLNDRERH